MVTDAAQVFFRGRAFGRIIIAAGDKSRLGQLSATSGLYVEGQRPSRQVELAGRMVPHGRALRL
jgi:hypothetical protein